MKIISVNVGQPTALRVGQRTAVSGIRKHPVPGRVRVGGLGLEGDHVLNRRHHGGPDQAVYVYTREDYDAWEEKLGRRLEAGTFGENLLISGGESAHWAVGDRLELGDGEGEGGAGAVLEVTAARIPCATLGARMEDAGFVKRFAALGRPGFYTRVLQPGEIGKGDACRRVPGPEGAPTIAQVFAASLGQEREEAELRRWLEYPLAKRLRADVEGWLAR